MASSTENTAPTATDTGVEHGPAKNEAASKATAERTAAIARYDKQREIYETAKGRNDKKAAGSASAKMSNASAAIRTAEMDLALAGWTGDAWVKPVIASRSSRQTPLSQSEIETSIAGLTALLKDERESVVLTAKQRIGALLKAAEKRGYQVADPR